MDEMNEQNPMEQSRAQGDGGDMPGGEMDRPVGGMPAVQTAIERNVAQLVDTVVERALAEVSDRRERNMVKELIAAELRTTLTELAEREAGRQMALTAGDGAGALAFGDAARTGMGVARQVQELGFVEFTAGLITGTFDAIIGATVKQMEAYAKLVADVSKSLAQFQAENVSDAQVNAHLVERFPDPTDPKRSLIRFSATSDPQFKGITGDKDNGTTAKSPKSRRSTLPLH